MRSPRDAAIASAVAVIALLGGAFAVRSLQVAAALALLIALLAVHSHSRRYGMIGLWAIWLLSPWLRRVLALAGESPLADPLALLPFVATAMLALVELRRSSLSREARAAVGLAAAGFLIGAPMGMLADPLAFGFGMTAYLAAVSAFVLGWGDGCEGRRPTLVDALLYGLPVLAAYGIVQYFAPLSSWDASWVSRPPTCQRLAVRSPYAIRHLTPEPLIVGAVLLWRREK